MTDSGTTPNHWKNNDLGGHAYTDEETAIIHAIAMLLKGRDKGLADAASIVNGTAPRPRDYIQLYTKTAGFIYELAKNLVAFPLPPNIPQKSIAEWIDLITGRLAGAPPARGPRIQRVPPERFLEGTGFQVDSVAQAIADGVLEVPAKRRIDGIDPEKAKAILIRICEEFPGLLNDEDTDCMYVVTELTILLRSAL